MDESITFTNNRFNIWNSDSWISFILQNEIRFRLALVIFFLWIISLIRAIKDANARSNSAWFVILAAMCIILLTPIFWILLYIAIRPQWRKWDKTPWRNNAFLHMHMCENCWEDNLINNKFCVNCGEPLQITCRECQTEYSSSYNYCPNCWAPHLED